MLHLSGEVTSEHIGLQKAVVFPAVEPERLAIHCAVVRREAHELNLRNGVVDVGLLSRDTRSEMIADLLLRDYADLRSFDFRLGPRLVDAPSVGHRQGTHIRRNQYGGNPVIFLILLLQIFAEYTDLGLRRDPPFHHRCDKSPLRLLEITVVSDAPVGRVHPVKERFSGVDRTGHVGREMIVVIVTDSHARLLPLFGSRQLRGSIDDAAKSLGIAVEI